MLNLLLNYPDQNISNQFKPKKMLSYIKTDKTDVTPMRSDGQITADTKQNSNILNKQCLIFMVTYRFLYHTMFLVCVFSVRSKISIRIRTDAVSSFNSSRILPLMLSGPQILCVLVLCKMFSMEIRYRVHLQCDEDMLCCTSSLNDIQHGWL
jgi:hypothetical protein